MLAFICRYSTNHGNHHYGIKTRARMPGQAQETSLLGKINRATKAQGSNPSGTQAYSIHLQ
jgi:hypothetical protein